jgi:hypothetical protein
MFWHTAGGMCDFYFVPIAIGIEFVIGVINLIYAIKQLLLNSQLKIRSLSR